MSYVGHPRDFVVKAALVSLLRFLVDQQFPRFDANYLYRIENWSCPQLCNVFDAVYEQDEVIEPFIDSFLVKQMDLDAQSPNQLTNEELRYSTIFAILHNCGCRPIQLNRLMTTDVQFLDHDSKTVLLQVPYAKHRFFGNHRIKIRLRETTADLLLAWISRRGGIKSAQLLSSGNEKPLLYQELQVAIHSTLKRFNDRSPSFDRLPQITPYDFRHNAASKMAMRGATADEIAYVLGHASTVTARHYILATPALARLKLRALGRNPAWIALEGAMMTGALSELNRLSQDEIGGYVDGVFIGGLGFCEAESCPFVRFRQCYGCKHFRPSCEGDHSRLRELVYRESEKVVEECDRTGQTSRNPFQLPYVAWIQEIDIVLDRIKSSKRETKSQPIDLYLEAAESSAKGAAS